VIEQAAMLCPQTETVVTLFPVRGERAVLRRQIVEHELAILDIGCPGKEPDRVHPDREKAVSLGGDQPPSSVPLLSAEKARRTKAANPRKPGEMVALRRFGEPLREVARFFGAPGAQHFDRAHLFRP